MAVFAYIVAFRNNVKHVRNPASGHLFESSMNQEGNVKTMN